MARQPYLRADGSLCTTPGYDAATGLFGVFEAGDFSPLPTPITKDDAKAALERLNDLLAEFPFASEIDRAAALAAMVTAAVRQALPTAPMFHVRAHAPGTGKSYLTELIAAFVSPAPMFALSFPSSNDECGKVMLADFASSPGVTVFDNLVTDILPFKTLCAALMQECITGQAVGHLEDTVGEHAGADLVIGQQRRPMLPTWPVAA